MYIASSVLYHTREFYTGADRQPSFDQFPLPASNRIFPLPVQQRSTILSYLYTYAIQVFIEVGNGILFQQADTLRNFLEGDLVFTNAGYKRFVSQNKIYLDEMKSKISKYLLQRSDDGSGGDFNTAALQNVGVRLVKDQIQDIGIFPRPLGYTLLSGQNWLGPGWGYVRGILGKEVTDEHEESASRFVKEGEAELEKEARRVYELSLTLGDQEKMIAEFWAGGPGTITPPGLWNLFLAISFEKNQASLSLEKMSRDWFLLASGLFQTSISVWRLKYHFFQARPIQTIRYLFATEFIDSYYGGDHVPASAWKPYQPDSFLTPPFPDFISGHSTFSACGARILTKILGGDLVNLRLAWRPEHLAMVSPLFRNAEKVPENAFLHCMMILPQCSEINGEYPEVAVPLTYSTWDDMALEAGKSRIYGGIHYDSSNYAGYMLGNRLAESICHFYQMYLNA